MNKVVNNVLLAGDKFMYEMHLRQPLHMCCLWSIYKKRERIKYSNIFAKGYVSNWSEKMFVLKKLKILCHVHIFNDLNGEEIVGTFYKKELQKKNQKELRIEKVIKRNGNKITTC